MSFHFRRMRQNSIPPKASGRKRLSIWQAQPLTMSLSFKAISVLG
jgi:hypothetical protein